MALAITSFTNRQYDFYNFSERLFDFPRLRRNELSRFIKKVIGSGLKRDRASKKEFAFGGVETLSEHHMQRQKIKIEISEKNHILES